MYDNLGFIPPFDNQVMVMTRPMVMARSFAVPVEGDKEKLTRLAGELGLPDYHLWVDAFGAAIVLDGLEEYDQSTLPFSSVGD